MGKGMGLAHIEEAMSDAVTAIGSQQDGLAKIEGRRKIDPRIDKRFGKFDVVTCER